MHGVVLFVANEAARGTGVEALAVAALRARVGRSNATEGAYLGLFDHANGVSAARAVGHVATLSRGETGSVAAALGETSHLAFRTGLGQ